MVAARCDKCLQSCGSAAIEGAKGTGFTDRQRTHDCGTRTCEPSIDSMHLHTCLFS